MLDPELKKKLISEGREFTRAIRRDDPYQEDYESDQMLKLPQPPLVKDRMRPDTEMITLCRDFSGLDMNNDLVSLIRNRKSSRLYTEESMTLDQLSFLLWATQGVKRIRGKKYATIRTVPSGGARHEFETYLIVQHVEGLQPGAYHYLPMEHALEFLKPIEDVPAAINDSMNGQSWAGKASVVFYWSIVAYRAEWRYDIYAHRITLIDAGHVGQNLYLACTGLGLGTCGIGSFSHEFLCDLFELDGEEEYPIYSAPVGTVRASELEEESTFYSFVTEEGL